MRRLDERLLLFFGWTFKVEGLSSPTEVRVYGITQFVGSPESIRIGEAPVTRNDLGVDLRPRYFLLPQLDRSEDFSGSFAAGFSASCDASS
jgi:hypothetical protein